MKKGNNSHLGLPFLCMNMLVTCLGDSIYLSMSFNVFKYVNQLFSHHNISYVMLLLDQITASEIIPIMIYLYLFLKGKSSLHNRRPCIKRVMKKQHWCARIVMFGMRASRSTPAGIWREGIDRLYLLFINVGISYINIHDHGKTLVRSITTQLTPEIEPGTSSQRAEVKSCYLHL